MALAGRITAMARRHSLNALTAVLFGLTFARLGFASELLAVLAFVFGGVLLAAIDWKVKRLPTRVVYLTGAGVAVGLLVAAVLEREWKPLVTAIEGALLFANAFGAVYLLGRFVVGMMLLGMGDVRLVGVIGLLLGWYGLKWVLYGAIAGNILVLVVALVMCIHQRKLLLRFSFGPSLIAGAWLTVMIHG